MKSGIVPGGYDFNADSAQLTALAKELEAARSILGLTEMSLTPAPVGVGFLTSHESVGLFRTNVLPILEKYSKSFPLVSDASIESHKKLAHRGWHLKCILYANPIPNQCPKLFGSSHPTQTPHRAHSQTSSTPATSTASRCWCKWAPSLRRARRLRTALMSL